MVPLLHFFYMIVCGISKYFIHDFFKYVSKQSYNCGFSLKYLSFTHFIIQWWHVSHLFLRFYKKKKRLPFFGHIHEIFWWIFTSFLMMMRRLNIALFVSISISNNCLIDFIDYGMFRSSKLKLFQLETTPVYICLCWSIFTFVYSSQAVWVYVFACKWFIWYKIGIL